MDSFSERSLPREARMYLAGLEIKGRQRTTLNRYAYDLEDYFLWLRAGKKGSFLNATGKTIRNYLDYLENEKKVSKRTIYRILSVLNRFYSHIRELDLAPLNPVDGISVKKNDAIVQFKKEDFISETEAEKLLQSIPTLEGLSENQESSRFYIGVRNLVIVSLFLHYGLTLAELVQLRMKNVRFETNQMHIPSVSSHSRTLTLEPENTKLLFAYYKKIPKAVRPRLHSDEPLFVAFDFQRNTYRWDYATDSPKALTEIAVQKMIRQEVARAGLRKGISSQHFRRTYILSLLLTGESPDFVQRKTGLKSKLALKRYLAFAEHEQNR
ncbi:MAG TPA: site-specific integrase [Bacillales bacterium]|nr:site-specific integrase [Bacillales bacterium]